MAACVGRVSPAEAALFALVNRQLLVHGQILQDYSLAAAEDASQVNRKKASRYGLPLFLLPH
jgi:hypothetical protein